MSPDKGVYKGVYTSKMKNIKNKITNVINVSSFIKATGYGHEVLVPLEDFFYKEMFRCSLELTIMEMYWSEEFNV